MYQFPNMKDVFSVLRFTCVLLTVFAQHILYVKGLLLNDAQYIESRLNQMDVKIQSLTAQLAAKDQNIALLTNRLNQKDQEVSINELFILSLVGWGEMPLFDLLILVSVEMVTTIYIFISWYWSTINFDKYIRVTWCVSYKKQELLTICEHLLSSPIFGGVSVTHHFSLLCCAFLVCLSSSCAWCTQFWIVHSWFSHRFF